MSEQYCDRCNLPWYDADAEYCHCDDPTLEELERFDTAMTKLRENLKTAEYAKIARRFPGMK